LCEISRRFIATKAPRHEKINRGLRGWHGLSQTTNEPTSAKATEGRHELTQILAAEDTPMR